MHNVALIFLTTFNFGGVFHTNFKSRKILYTLMPSRMKISRFIKICYTDVKLKVYFQIDRGSSRNFNGKTGFFLNDTPEYF